MPSTVKRKVAVAAHVWTDAKDKSHVAVNGDVVELPDDERTAEFTEKGYLVAADADIAPVSAATSLGTPAGVHTGGTAPVLLTDAELAEADAETLLAYVEANPGEKDRVLEAERARGGKARKTVLALEG